MDRDRDREASAAIVALTQYYAGALSRVEQHAHMLESGTRQMLGRTHLLEDVYETVVRFLDAVENDERKAIMLELRSKASKIGIRRNAVEPTEPVANVEPGGNGGMDPG